MGRIKVLQVFSKSHFLSTQPPLASRTSSTSSLSNVIIICARSIYSSSSSLLWPLPQHRSYRWRKEVHPSLAKSYYALLPTAITVSRSHRVRAPRGQQWILTIRPRTRALGSKSSSLFPSSPTHAAWNANVLTPTPIAQLRNSHACPLGERTRTRCPVR